MSKRYTKFEIANYLQRYPGLVAKCCCNSRCRIQFRFNAERGAFETKSIGEGKWLVGPLDYEGPYELKEPDRKPINIFERDV